MLTSNTKLDARSPRERRLVPFSLHMVSHRAFTLTELVVAIAIFVILLAMAVPVFRTITGSRSIASATNVVSAKLNRIRMEAVGLQQYRAAMFYLDQNTGRVGIVTLKYLDESGPIPIPTIAKAMFGVIADKWFDLAADTETVLLPVGVGMETVIGNAPGGNRYIGFNDIADFGAGKYYTTANRAGGIVVFDPSGRLFTGIPGIVWWNSLAGAKTDLGAFLFDTNYVPGGPLAEPSGSSMFYPTLALCLFESDPYLQLPVGFRLDGKPLRDGFEDDYHNPMSTEATREDWLNYNSMQFFINRYNGTLIKGE